MYWPQIRFRVRKELPADLPEARNGWEHVLAWPEGHVMSGSTRDHVTEPFQHSESKAVLYSGSFVSDLECFVPHSVIMELHVLDNVRTQWIIAEGEASGHSS